MYQVTIQRQVPQNSVPELKQLKSFAKTILKLKTQGAELNIRIVDIEEMTDLNLRYRNKNKATNILSFPFDVPDEVDDDLIFLGDIVLCADVINEEAKLYNKDINAHWAHLIVHGSLHLLGYDHETPEDAAKMEPEEVLLLKQLGFSDPYK